MTTRREFLKQAAFVLAGLSSSILADAAAEAKGGYKIGSWTGDDFTFGHKLRDNKMPKLPTQPTEKVDFVIVGGGLSGLASAHYLKDSNYLLLEQYEDLGGHARGGSYQGIGYSYGAAYLSIMEGAIGDLIEELGLNPIKLADHKDAWYLDGKWVKGTEGSDDVVLYREFKRLRAEYKDFWGKWDGLYSALHEFPEYHKLDNILMEDVLKGYDPKFVAFIDAFVKSGLGGGVKTVSALSGLSDLDDIFNATYLLPGGNPALTGEITKRLKKSHPDRLKTGAFVWDVHLKDDGATVTYGLRDGSMHMVECRHVIFSIPQLVAARIARNLPDKCKATMFRFRYGSYLVANMLMKEKVFQGTYDNFLAPPFEIADITPAETAYMLNGTYKPEMGSVLTIYVPYEPGSPGRTILYTADKKKMAAGLIEQLVKVEPKIAGKIEEVVLTRWGHALAVPKPQHFKYIGELQSFESKSFSFAHSSAHGLPGAEEAVQGALHATQRARESKISAKPIYSIQGVG